MPVATTEQYAAMLDATAYGHYAFAGVDVTSAETLTAVLEGFAQAGAQVSTGGVEFLSGDARDMALGARTTGALAESAGRSLAR